MLSVAKIETARDRVFLDLPIPGGGVQRLKVHVFPFHIGRSHKANLSLTNESVSRKHATIARIGDCCWLQDLESANGTFVNGERIKDRSLANEDIIQIAEVEMRYVCSACACETMKEEVPIKTKVDMVDSEFRGARHLKELVSRRCFDILYQPIVCLRSGDPIGYEALGRSTHERLRAKTSQLFALAAEYGLASELSLMLRHEAVQIGRLLPAEKRLFLNLHPCELEQARPLTDLDDLRALAGADRQLVLEIRDTGADLANLGAICNDIKTSGMQVAYDNFGAGQDRLLELADIPPDFLKIDRSLIHNINASKARQTFVQALARASGCIGVRVIAQGVETREEAAVCEDLGCHYGQGFFFGRPKPLAACSATTHFPL